MNIDDVREGTSIDKATSEWKKSFTKQLAVRGEIPTGTTSIRFIIYSGVAVLWKNKFDSFVTSIADGSERIQCIELGNKENSSRKTLIISVYFPCRGYTTSNEDFCTCIDELYEIVVKYSPTHNILVGADVNEDLNKYGNDRRQLYIHEFIRECHVHYGRTAPTFMHPNGTDKSEIDYFFKSGEKTFINTCKSLIELNSNVSDHVPIVTEIPVILKKNKKVKNCSKQQVLPPRTNWDKVDKSEYLQTVNEKLDLSDLDGSVECVVKQLCDVMADASAKINCVPKNGKRSQPKLAVWNEEVSVSLRASMEAHKIWAKSGKNFDPDDPLFIERKLKRKEFRKKCRIAVAEKLADERHETMEARTGNTKLFYKLINKQRGSLRNNIDDLHVAGSCYSGESSILEGFKQHFSNLAKISNNEQFDNSYHEQVEKEVEVLSENMIYKDIDSVSILEFDKALKSVNKGKSADIYGISIEHVLNGGENLQYELLKVINRIFEKGEIPKILKTGLVSPVFKNKGHPTEAVNYRGITVLPTICKIIEIIIRNRIQDKILSNQNSTQRGFTKGTSPLNAAYILEEYYRDCADSKTDAHVILLDAKAAFDVVCHTHLLRRLYHAGVDDKHWLLIKSLHQDTSSVVKLNNQISDSFDISQGVRQGGILSTDLYKLYVNPLLNQLEHINVGGKIGTLNANNCACADDICLMSPNAYDTQLLINVARNFADEERYLLQPTKTVAISIKSSRKPDIVETSFELGDTQLKNVKQSLHLGITRTQTIKQNYEVNVNNNLAKARRTLYSLFGAGLHGENGLDPVTAIGLYRAYVLPVLLYGLEILIPPQKLVDRIEVFHKRTLKQILSLPDNAADPSIYILTGLLPVRALLDLRILSFFNNVCNQNDDSLDKQILIRQLTIKTGKSCSWAMQIPGILARYGLESVFTYIENPLLKHKWKSYTHKIVELYWKNIIEDQACLYTTLKYMNCVFQPGKVHPVLQVPCASVLEVSRMATRLKLLTGTYVLQVNRARFNQNAVNPMCQSCNGADETLEHFMLLCPALAEARYPVINTIIECLQINSLLSLDPTGSANSNILNILMDYSRALPAYVQRCDIGKTLEFHTRRLCFRLHKARETIYKKSLSS